MNEKRAKRLNAEFQKEIYDILKNKIKSPFITEMFSISDVEVSNDLKYARVYVSVYSADEEKKKKTFDAICDSAKAVRKELGRVMRIKMIPEIRFICENSAEYGSRIDELLGTLTYYTTEEGDENDD